MINVIRTTNSNCDFLELVKQLDADLAIRDGEDHAFYAQFNKLDDIKHVVVAYEETVAIGCGAIKKYEKDAIEIKRMYTIAKARGKGVATEMLKELEDWSRELNCKICILETGIKQPEAIALYKKNGYTPIQNYGQYQGVDTSVCFEKKI